MKISLLVIAAVAAVASAEVLLGENDLATSQTMVDFVNGMKTTWTASTEQGPFFAGATVNQARRLMGALPAKDGPRNPRITHSKEARAVPEEFDSRTQWPQCWTIQQIRDQSACGSCWAFGAVEAISDRYCVSGVAANLSISAQDLNSCCDSCGAGCGGGYPASAWAYWSRTGLSTEKCDPYSLPSCDHHLPNSTHPCPQNEYNTPACKRQCVDGETWKNTIHFGKDISSASGEADIMAEIYQNGPVETAFTVYADFPSYKSGIYQQTSNQVLGGHAVKFVGWGVENSTKYWLVANSWNVHWGAEGFFKIIRGVNECGIEDEIDFGTPAK